MFISFFFFFFQAEDGIRDLTVTEFRRVLFRSQSRRHYALPLQGLGGHRGRRQSTVGRCPRLVQRALSRPTLHVTPGRTGHHEGPEARRRLGGDDHVGADAGEIVGGGPQLSVRNLPLQRQPARVPGPLGRLDGQPLVVTHGRPPSASSFFHCAAVSGTTERRPTRTRGWSLNAGSALMSASGTGRGSLPLGFRSTTTSFGSRALGSA